MDQSFLTEEGDGHSCRRSDKAIVAAAASQPGIRSNPLKS